MHPNWKRNKTVFTDDMIFRQKYLKKSTKSLLEHIIKFSNILGFKMDVQKSTFLYTINEKSETEMKQFSL